MRRSNPSIAVGDATESASDVVASVGARAARILARLTIRTPTALALKTPAFVPAYRAIVAQMSLAFGRTPHGTRLTPVREPGIRGEWIVPRSGTLERTIFYLHGGGYVGGSPAQYRSLTGALALACNARVLVLDYRLAPEHPFPAALEDALAAYGWLLEQGHDPSRIVVAGDSAGGGLSLSFLLAARDRGVPLPAGAVLLCPWVDLAGRGESLRSNARSDDAVVSDPSATIARLYAGRYALDDPGPAGLYANLEGLPPMLVHASSIEVLRDDAVRLVDKARAAGVDATLRLWNGVPHVWHLFRAIPESREALADIALFVERSTQRCTVVS